ncbi:MAG: M20/M25/M40 family metallo-hydrolase, partial [Candidatus Binatia bacterium]
MSAYLREVTERLVAFDTVSSKSNLAAAEFLAERLEAARFRVALQRYERDGVSKANVVARLGPPEPGGLILCGHVDTVPFAGQPGWERDPLRFELGAERAFGRGTSDMKVFLAHCLDAARGLEPAALERPVVCLFTADEEVGCLGAARLVEELPALLEETPLPTSAWIGEPTSYRV